MIRRQQERFGSQKLCVDFRDTQHIQNRGVYDLQIRFIARGLKTGMLIIKCAACKRKLWKYDKIGHGEVLRCYKDRITKVYTFRQDDHKIKCQCGRPIGLDKGDYIKMIDKAFVYTGTKRNG